MGMGSYKAYEEMENMNWAGSLSLSITIEFIKVNQIFTNYSWE